MKLKSSIYTNLLHHIYSDTLKFEEVSFLSSDQKTQYLKTKWICN